MAKHDVFLFFFLIPYSSFVQWGRSRKLKKVRFRLLKCISMISKSPATIPSLFRVYRILWMTPSNKKIQWSASPSSENISRCRGRCHIYTCAIAKIDYGLVVLFLFNKAVSYFFLVVDLSWDLTMFVFPGLSAVALWLSCVVSRSRSLVIFNTQTP